MATSGGKFAALASYKKETSPTATGRPKGKRSDPRYEPTTLLLQITTKRQAWRRLEDIGSGMDLSDLAEKLITDWLDKNTNV